MVKEVQVYVYLLGGIRLPIFGATLFLVFVIAIDIKGAFDMRKNKGQHNTNFLVLCLICKWGRNTA